MAAEPTPLALSIELFHPGMRAAVGVSGGADSVALLRALLAERDRLGLVLSVAHLHHGIRGEEADADAAFVASLATQWALPFHLHRVNTPESARLHHETLEEAARNLRYAWFRELVASGQVDAVATAHTLDDQAETVLHKLLRGAWTEGLSGIHPSLPTGPGTGPSAVLRPMLGVRRMEVEAWLRALGQPWREDSTNRDDAYTRNRIRHQLLPLLAEFNPQVQVQLAQLAVLARDEEAYWQAELARLLPSLLLPGRPVRGGGRAASTHPGESSVAVEIERLRLLPAAVRRRVLRAAARQVGVNLSFEQTDRLMEMCGFGPASGAKPARTAQLAADLRAERTPRELRLLRADPAVTALTLPVYELAIPGLVEAPAYGVRLRAELAGSVASSLPSARVRAAQPGDRVHLRHSRSPKKVKEVLERMGVPAVDRKGWPVLDWQGQILWMRGAEITCIAAAAAGLTVTVEPLVSEPSVG